MLYKEIGFNLKVNSAMILKVPVHFMSNKSSSIQFGFNVHIMSKLL